MVFKKESDFEEALIKILSEKGWEKEVIKYPTEKELIQNWANILFDNNRGQDRLDKYPLTEGEMQQIIEQIMELRTPLKLNGFINGKTVSVKRDNPDDKLHFGKEISLKIYDRQEIAAGQSRYQIVQQPVFPSKSNAISDVVSKTKWARNNQRGGYIWHTTGSGKTMTSFKSAQLIANSNDADKVVSQEHRFLMKMQEKRVPRQMCLEMSFIDIVLQMEFEIRMY